MKNSLFIIAVFLMMSSCTLSVEDTPQPIEISNDVDTFGRAELSDDQLSTDSPKRQNTEQAESVWGDLHEVKNKGNVPAATDSYRSKFNDYKISDDGIYLKERGTTNHSDPKTALYNGAIDPSKGLKAVSSTQKHKTD